MKVDSRIKACVFDAYGTLFDFSSAVARCPDVPNEHRINLTTLWRDKQLQYTWLRSLQADYVDFWQVTGDALDFALDSLGLGTPGRRAALMDLYRTLSPYPEVADVLRQLRTAGVRTAILSNGTPQMLSDAISAGGLEGLFDEVLSADMAGRFKTDPAVYQLALDALALPARAISFQSSNGWDAYGASAFGMRVVWCNRYGQKPERLPGHPDAEVKTLAELPAIIFGRWN
ncbi:MAG: haloacid dehalogenase type II [Paracoccaceae bacterium]|nr:haloacid dehalogenase type II [Paracoccaceae bacterium]